MFRTVDPYHWPPLRGSTPSMFIVYATVSIAAPARRKAGMRLSALEPAAEVAIRGPVQQEVDGGVPAGPVGSQSRMH